MGTGYILVEVSRVGVKRVPSPWDSVLFSRPHGTAVPGFPVPPLRGWSFWRDRSATVLVNEGLGKTKSPYLAIRALVFGALIMLNAG
jgi:hypothetical protein